MKPILVVEGDDDLFLIKPHLSDGVLLIKGTGGKRGVLDAARTSDSHRLEHILFFVDLDFDQVLGQNQPYPSSVRSSTHHDVIMDTIIVNRQVLERVIEVHSRHHARKMRTDISVSDCLESALSLAGHVACLRLANHRDGLGLNLRDFPFGAMVSITPSSAEIAQLALARSDAEITLEDLTSKIEVEAANHAHLHHKIVGDHDLFRATARVLAYRGVAGVSADHIWTATLAALHCKHIMNTSWFATINSWAAASGQLAMKCPCPA